MPLRKKLFLSDTFLQWGYKCGRVMYPFKIRPSSKPPLKQFKDNRYTPERKQGSVIIGRTAAANVYFKNEMQRKRRPNVLVTTIVHAPDLILLSQPRSTTCFKHFCFVQNFERSRDWRLLSGDSSSRRRLYESIAIRMKEWRDTLSIARSVILTLKLPKRLVASVLGGRGRAV